MGTNKSITFVLVVRSPCIRLVVRVYILPFLRILMRRILIKHVKCEEDSRTGTQGNLSVLIGFVVLSTQPNAEGSELAVFYRW